MRIRRIYLWTGSFFGTVHNFTGDLRANFGISVGENQGTIFGCMGVQEPLFGSGPLRGSVNGAAVYFYVTSSVFELQFEGQRNGNRLSHTYRVVRQDGRDELGEFELERKDAKKLGRDFDPQKDCPTDADINR